MRFTRTLIPTLREAPKDADVESQKLMIKAGYIRKVAAGIYNYLPLGLRVVRKIESIIRAEMFEAGAAELLMPMVQPAELWIESKRWDVYGKELLRLKDRHGREFCLGPTHEEVITDIVRKEISSWRDLPKNFFQIQTKFRDEIRPRFGLMRSREFIMKDAYSFDRDSESAKKSYRLMYETYRKIFSRCGLSFRAVEAMTGTIGGSMSHEFQVLAESGEDEIVSCNKCNYAANVEKAELRKPDVKSDSKPEKGKFEKVETPDTKTVEQVCDFLKIKPAELIKTIIVNTDKGPYASLVRGDHHLKEAKLKEAIDCEWCEFAEDKMVQDITNAPVGFAGPVGLEIPVIADYSVMNMKSFVTGANIVNTHFTNVNLADISNMTFADIRRAGAGDQCPRCKGVYEVKRGIEVGQVFYLGNKYSESLGAYYLDENGDKQTIEMGCYGIGVGRTAASAVEQNHDEKGIVWPVSIAPFEVEIIPLAIDGEVCKVSEKIYKDLSAIGLDVLIDDRDVRAGVKFADADLIGIPYRIVIGARGLKDNVVEIKIRRTDEIIKVKPTEIRAKIKTLIDDERGRYGKI